MTITAAIDPFQTPTNPASEPPCMYHHFATNTISRYPIPNRTQTNNSMAVKFKDGVVLGADR